MAEKPSQIHSQVPGEQKLRTSNELTSEANSSLVDENKVEIYTDRDYYSPVIKITKQETTFTKGDLKLQRVSNIHGYSPRVQRMRKFHKNQSSLHGNSDDTLDSKIKNEGHPTKIPGLRVRQVVEKFKVEEPPADKNPRRSSIPKLIPKTRTRTSSVDNNKGTYRISRKERSSIEDKFEKIYVEAAIEIDKIDDKLNEIVTDIEDADDKFEMVANSYEIIEAPTTEKRQSKIPIKRIASQHEKGKLQNIDRRHSINTNVINNNIKKLSKKRINSIDNLNELLKGANKKRQQEQELFDDLENNVNTNIQETEHVYDNLKVTLLPYKKEDNEPPKTNLDEEHQDVPSEVQIRTSDKIINNQSSASIELINEAVRNDKRGFRESYIVEHNGEIPIPKAEDIPFDNKPANRVIFKEESQNDYENIEIRPVLSKIALFERSRSCPKFKTLETPEIEKSIDHLEVNVSNKEETSDYGPIMKIIKEEIVKNRGKPSNKNKPALRNANQSITVESESKTLEDNDKSKIKLKSKSSFRKSKSTPDLDTGGALSYQKQRKYNRLSSVEKLVQKIERNNKVCNIDIKEMPKKKSVLEKIALFEGKRSQPYTDQIPRKMVESIKYKLLNYANNPERNLTRNKIDASVKNDPYAEKIEGLKKAKLQYGTLSDVKFIQLNNGVEMPVIALGTALLDPEETFHVITAAIDLGYRAFDTAYIDGNEREVGEAIKYKINEGTVTRQELFIINKLWSTFHRTDLVEQACKNSLEVMQLDYFDLYLIHNPMSFKEGPNPIPKIANVLQYSSSDYLDAWFGMEMLVYKGLARSIGLSNFNSMQLARIIEKGKIMPVLNQVESHPYLSQVRLQEFCSIYNVLIQSYGVLGSTNHVLVDSLVRICAAGMSAEPAQTLIRFQLDMDRAVVVKASTAHHLWSNLQSTEIDVNPADLRALHALNNNKRMFNYKGLGDTHRNYPFHIPF